MNRLRYIAGLLLLGIVVSAEAVTPSPKRDFRGAWLSTVWAIDWPNHRGNTDEDTKSQKVELRTILSNYEKCNINACFFQVRGMSDAMYNSKYEPWSQYLTGTRGLAPTYDPLQFLIDEAHARGIEVHAWLNPYRYATSEDNYGTLPSDYSVVHPDWLINCGGITILNPGEPTVRQRIVDIVCDIIDKYDVDGIVFDDYFYQDGMRDEYDDRLYALYNPDSLSRADWRRAQVNLMVAQVNAAIKARKPWCRFGISPAGVAASNKAVAEKYGISPCPAGSDWQYSQIYAEPVQWYVEQSLDYISPQVYWTIGSASDYAKITPWWYVVANKFGRHCYISQSLSALSPTKSMPAGMTGRERIAAANQSTAFYADEIANQILIDHASTKENAPGSVFFSSKQIAKTGFIKTVVRDAYTRKAIVPNLTWFQPAEMQGLVSDLTRSGQTLSWNYATAGQRFGVYAMPSSKRHDTQALTTSLYYQGLTYANSFTLADSITTDYAVCVTVIDRYGNEYAPRFLGEEQQAAVIPQLTYPADNDRILLPNYLSWQPIADAMGYQVEIASDAGFTRLIATVPTDTNAFLTQPIQAIDGRTTCYWRVRAMVPNSPSAYSETRSFRGRLFSVVYPEDGESGLTVTPTIRWDDIMQGAEYEVEIATAISFAGNTIVFSATTSDTEITVSEDILTYGTNYYVRVHMHTPYLDVTSTPNLFTTVEVTMVPPSILSPSMGEVLTDSVQVTWSNTPNNGFRLEWAASESFPNRSKKVKTVDMGTYSCNIGVLAEGTWYLRIATKCVDETWTDYSEVVSFTCQSATDLSKVVALESDAPCYDMLGRKVSVRQAGHIYIQNGRLIYQQ